MKIEALRLDKHWTQEELAEGCGLNVRTIQRAESGQAISGKSLKEIASALNTEISEFDIGYVSLDTGLIDRKLATQFPNVKVSQGEASTNIEIYFNNKASRLRFLLQLVIMGGPIFAVAVLYWLETPSIQLRWLVLSVAIFLTVPPVFYTALQEWLGKITINISRESLRQQLHLGPFKVTDRCFDADLVSDFKVCRHSWPRYRRYCLQFQYGFKTTRMDMGHLEAEGRFVMGKVEQALEST
jgi:transcriptional regulator with XRE-family HTH domain